MNLETIILNLIAHSGESKSYSMEAISHAKAGHIDLAQKSLEDAAEKMAMAHKSQTTLIQNEAKGEKIETSILLIHAQDHLMNAITIRDLAVEMVDMYKMILKQTR